MTAASEIITETGGFRVGRNAWLAFNGSWPFGKLQIHRDRLILEALWQTYTFPRPSIVALSVYSGFFSRGLRIQHSIPAYPSFVVFWSYHMSRVQQRLTEAGFRVDDAKA